MPGLGDGSGGHPGQRHGVGRARRRGAPAGAGAQPGPARRVVRRRGRRRAGAVRPGRAGERLGAARARRPRSRSRSGRPSARRRRPGCCRSRCARCPRWARRRRPSPRARLELAGAAGLQAWADATTASGRWSGKYRLSFSNQGNAAGPPVHRRPRPVGGDAADGSRRDPLRAAGRPGRHGDRGQGPPTVPAGIRRRTGSSRRPARTSRSAPNVRSPARRRRATTPTTARSSSRSSRSRWSPRSCWRSPRSSSSAWSRSPCLRLRGGEEVALGLAPPRAARRTFTAEPAGSSTIFLSWSRVPNAAGYDIRRPRPTGKRSGPAVEHVDGSTLTFTVEQLGPGETHCFAVEATGPEGVDNSLPSGFDCATTTVAPTLAAPTNFQATRGLARHVRRAVGSTDHGGRSRSRCSSTTSRSKEGIAGLFTTVDIPRRELTYEAELKVQGRQRRPDVGRQQRRVGRRHRAPRGGRTDGRRPPPWPADGGDGPTTAVAAAAAAAAAAGQRPRRRRRTARRRPR